MRNGLRIGLVSLSLLVIGSGAGWSQPQSHAFNTLLGVGGSLDETEAGYGNPNWQLGFTNEIADKTRFAVRLGGIHWSSADLVGDTVGPSLLYLTVATEYAETTESFSGSFVQPGIYLGLGYYNLDGEDAEGNSVSDNGPGLVLGLTGDIDLNSRRSLALRLEFSVHYAALDAAQLFGLAQIGISYRF